MNTPKKVLMVAYYFPPLGMGGTQRTAKFVKYLPHFGWQPVVLTVKEVAYYSKDASLLEDVRGAEIDRSGSLDPQRLLALFSAKKAVARPASFQKGRWRWAHKLLAWLCIPDTKVLWLPFAFLCAVRLLRKGEIDAILTTSPPHSVHLLGYVLKKIYRLPWVADFRDGWAGGNFQYEPTALHKALNRHLQNKILKTADAVVAVSSGLLANLRARHESDPAKFHLITNGFDQADTPASGDLPANEKFTMTYCGAVSAIAPLDSFMQALGDVLNSRPELSGQLAVKIVGLDLVGDLAECIRTHGVEGVVERTGYVSHRKAIEEIFRADLLLYPVAPWASPDFIPGKTFEYLASGNPVLIIGPAVEGAEILRAGARTEIVGHDDPGQIARAILKYHDLRQCGALEKKSSSKAADFERKKLTGELAQVLDRLRQN